MCSGRPKRLLCIQWAKVCLGLVHHVGFSGRHADAKMRRQTLALRSLSRVPPSSAEAAELHEVYLKYGQDDDSSSRYERVWMGDTLLEKTMLMFPQERKLVFFLNSSSFVI